MRHLTRFFDATSARIWRPIERRFRSARPGNVLILVITLLVLLAIIGTAMLATARTDRVSSARNVVNSQVDVFVDSASNMAIAAIVGDLFGLDVQVPPNKDAYRPIIPDSTVTTVNPPPYHDTTFAQHDPNWGATPNPPDPHPFLAERIPVLNLPASPAPKWMAITGPLTPPFPGASLPQFESPIPAASGANLYTQRGTNPAGSGMAPTFLSAPGKLYPAWKIGSDFFVAGDADGDGIADSGLIRLTPQPVDGLTYYAGIRIIDNGAAVNANTAWSNSTDFDFSTGAKGSALYAAQIQAGTAGAPDPLLYVYGAFPSNVGLQEILYQNNGVSPSGTFTPPIQTPDQEMASLQAYLRNGVAPNSGMQAPEMDYPPATNGIGVIHPDYPTYSFSTQGQALAMMLARRLDNPGFITPGTAGTPPTPGIRYHPLNMNDSAALAYRFIMINPSTYVASTASGPSAVESILFDSAYRFAPNNPANPLAPVSGGKEFTPNNADLWFDYNFNYAVSATSWGSYTSGLPANLARPIRALLTARNPVSNLAGGHVTPTMVPNNLMAPYGCRGQWFAALVYYPGDSVFDATTSQYYVCIQANTGQPVTNNMFWKVFTGAKGIYANMSNYAAGDIVQYTDWFYVSLADNNKGNDPLLSPSVWKRLSSSPKTCVNTATFGELWRSYWNVMTGTGNNDTALSVPAAVPATGLYYGSQFDNTADPAIPLAGEDPLRMFRSSIRDPRGVNTLADTAATAIRLPPDQQMLLRSALAALNTQILRGDTITNFPTITLTTTTAGPVTATLYGTRRQPYLTEIYVNNDPATVPTGVPGNNPNGYWAMEFCNPYPTPMVIAGWELRTINRKGAAPTLDAAPVGTPINVTIPAATAAGDGFLIIENLATGNAQYRPAAVTTPVAGQPAPVLGQTGPATNPQVVTVYEPLDMAYDKEIVLVDPATAVAPSPGTPIDSFDFTGLTPAVIGPNMEVTSWHYVRANAPAPGPASKQWHFVYPGRYDGFQTSRRQQGTEEDDTGVIPDPATATMEVGDWNNGRPPAEPILLGLPDGEASYSNGSPATATFPIQIYNTDTPGYNPLSATLKQHPFGQFMRNGDILQVPFIGAYAISLGSAVVELNSVSMDASFAEDTDQTDDGLRQEQIGRFCPIFPLKTAPIVPGAADDLKAGGDYVVGAVVPWRYHWATHLFDYFTVSRHPQDDYLPDVDPVRYNAAGGGAVSLVPNVNRLTANTPAEDTAPIDGLININTASWKVLAALPFVPNNDPAKRIGLNERIARAIVQYRDVNDGTGAPHGPFKSIFELNKVFDYQDTSTPPPMLYQGFYDPINSGTASIPDDPDDLWGDVSPYNTPPSGAPPTPTTDQVVGDFEDTFLIINRISNLVTTRSDSFTVYVVVEGWKNAGHPNSSSDPVPAAERIVQRRAAFIVDRSAVTPTNRTVNTYTVPTD